MTTRPNLARVYFHEQRLVFLVVIVGLEQNRLFVHRGRGVLGGFIHGRSCIQIVQIHNAG